MNIIILNKIIIKDIDYRLHYWYIYENEKYQEIIIIIHIKL
jgi:hypothetical protein